MNYSNYWPAMDGRPLDYWLDSDVARMAPVQTQSALRDIAWAYGQWLGFRAAVGGLGATLVGAGFLSLAVMGESVTLWLTLILAGLALTTTAGLVGRVKLANIAHGKQPRSSRAAGTSASGIGLALFISAIMSAIMFSGFSGWLSQGPGPAFSLFAICLLILCGSLSVFAAPGYCAQHGRRFFRSRIDSDPKLRQELEAMSLAWRDPVANNSFGSL
ncbi:hypothetical protein [Arthrobacter sp. GMC3]|uniref:hypothetical protein n=1 Tax=Arthrobacter sp. GMC3 TaxID=2058894 RepID=UPI0011B0A446|nr:hypothetical protein [Arthrobacter sp. GMC3]